MHYDYIITNFQKDEPIFLEELPGRSRESVRQEMKKLTDAGKVERLYNGVYYLAYETILGTKGRISVDKFVQKRFLEVDGKRLVFKVTAYDNSGIIGTAKHERMIVDVKKFMEKAVAKKEIKA